jgi:hemoglobin
MLKTTRPAAALLALACLLPACATKTQKVAEQDFYTSGSRDADQRAEQRVSKVQQLRGEGEATGSDAVTSEKKTLFERLGGDVGVRRIVDDFVDRAVADPRANFKRGGVKSGGVLGVGGKSIEWGQSSSDVAALKAHMAQFIAVATGGPTRYDGRDMKRVHEGMRITNAEFDAVIGDLKASLDALRVGVQEQKELLAVLESSRPQIAEER